MRRTLSFGIATIVLCSPVFAQDKADALTDNGAKLLELATKRFGQLTAADERLFRAVATGKPALYTSEPNQTLPADRLVWLCTVPAASKLITHRGLQVHGARVAGVSSLCAHATSRRC